MVSINLDKVTLSDRLSQYFKTCYKVLPSEGSFCIAFMFSMLFSVAKHRKSSKGMDLFNRVLALVNHSEKLDYLKRLILKFRNFDENFASESLEHLIRTEGALKSLNDSSVIIMKILTNPSDQESESSCIDLSKVGLECLAKSLDITLLVISNEIFEYFNPQDGNLILWTIQENSGFFVLFSKLGLQNDDFPFIYREVKQTENHESSKIQQIYDFQVRNVEYELGYNGKLVQVDFWNSSNFQFLSLVTGIMHGLLENKDFCESFIQKFREISEQFQDLENNTTIQFFLDYLTYFNHLPESFDLLKYLNEMKTQFEYFANAFYLLGCKLFERNQKKNAENLNFLALLELFPTVLNISIVVYKGSGNETFNTFFKKQEVWVLLRETDRGLSSLLVKNEGYEVSGASASFSSSEPTSSEKIPVGNKEVTESDRVVELKEERSSPTNPENYQSIQNIVYSIPSQSENLSQPEKINEIYQNPGFEQESIQVTPIYYPPQGEISDRNYKINDPNIHQSSDTPVVVQPTNYFNPSYSETIIKSPPSNFNSELSKDLLTSFKQIFNIFKKKVMRLEKISEIQSKLIKTRFSSIKTLANSFSPQECTVGHSFKKYLILDCFHAFCIECLFESIHQTQYYACPLCENTLKQKIKVLIYRKVFKMYRVECPKVKIQTRIQKKPDLGMLKCIICLKEKTRNYFKLHEKCKFECVVCVECRNGNKECQNCKNIENFEIRKSQMGFKLCAVCNKSDENPSFDINPCKNKCAVCFECRKIQPECPICRIVEDENLSAVTISKNKRQEVVQLKCDSCGKGNNSWFFPPYCKKCQICISCALATKKCFQCESRDVVLYENRCPSCAKEIRTNDLDVPFNCHHFYHKRCVPKGKSSNCYACRHGIKQAL